MLNSVSLNTVSKSQLVNQAAGKFKQAPVDFAQEGKILVLPKKESGQVDVKDMANAVKEANVADGGKTKLQKAEENLKAAEAKMENAIKNLQEKQEKVNSLKEKMKNTKNIFKKAGLAIAYGCAKAGLKIAELAVKAATGYVKLLRNIVEKLR